MAETSSNPGTAPRINDGLYGNAAAWSPAAADSSPFVVVRFNRTIPVSSLAWSRDNGDTNELACGGTCTDHVLGTYTLQYTAVADPASVTAT